MRGAVALPLLLAGLAGCAGLGSTQKECPPPSRALWTDPAVFEAMGGAFPLPVKETPAKPGLPVSARAAARMHNATLWSVGWAPHAGAAAEVVLDGLGSVAARADGDPSTVRAGFHLFMATLLPGEDEAALWASLQSTGAQDASGAWHAVASIGNATPASAALVDRLGAFPSPTFNPQVSASDALSVGDGAVGWDVQWTRAMRWTTSTGPHAFLLGADADGTVEYSATPTAGETGAAWTGAMQEALASMGLPAPKSTRLLPPCFNP